jgi:DnaJ like chaperone protein
VSVWQRMGELLGSFSGGTGFAGSLGQVFDPDNWLPGGKDAAFTLALVALSAKMAVADGVVTSDEVRAFRQTVDIPPESVEQITRLFELARQDVAGYPSYARKIARLFAGSPDTLEHVLDGLFHIAAADGLIHEDELEYLRHVSAIFGFDEERFEQIAAQHMVNGQGADPYIVLGLDPSATDEEVKRVYRLLAREHHPDRLVAKGVPEELLRVAGGRMAAINKAYKTISEMRGL